MTTDLRALANDAINLCSEPDYFVVGDVGANSAEILHTTGGFACGAYERQEPSYIAAKLNGYIRGYRAATIRALQEASRG